MAFTKVFQNNRYQAHYVQFVADTAEDVKRLPASQLSMGSEVYVIAEKKTYILDSKRVWHAKAENDDSVIECDCEPAVWEEFSETT